MLSASPLPAVIDHATLKGVVRGFIAGCWGSFMLVLGSALVQSPDLAEFLRRMLLVLPPLALAGGLAGGILIGFVEKPRARHRLGILLQAQVLSAADLHHLLRRIEG